MSGSGKSKSQLMQPITLYPTKILSPQEIISDFGTEQRVVSLHIEIQLDLAKQLLRHLQERIDEGSTAGIRIGFEGHLKHG